MFVIRPGQPGQLGSGAPRVTSDPYLTGSASMASGAMPKMIVFFRLTCHQSSEKEALVIGSKTMPGVLFVEVFGLRSGLPPTGIGDWVPPSRGSSFVSLVAGRPGGLPPPRGSPKPGAL